MKDKHADSLLKLIARKHAAFPSFLNHFVTVENILSFSVEEDSGH